VKRLAKSGVSSAQPAAKMAAINRRRNGEGEKSTKYRIGKKALKSAAAASAAGGNQ
jgi:hypothetical protein